MLVELLAVLALTVPPAPAVAAFPPSPVIADLRGLLREERRREHLRAVRRHRRIERRRRHLRWVRERPLRALAAARAQVGVPYVWGGESPWGFDCSGLVRWAYSRVGVWLPRTTWGQMLIGRPVSLSALRPGDLVFGEGGGHVGIYAGGGMVLNAPHTGSVVSYAPLYGWGWQFARRVVG